MAVPSQDDGRHLGTARRLTPLPGRGAECARIGEAIGLASEARCQRIWVVGAPGTGKSATCQWAIDQAPAFLPVRWACIEGEGELPLGALTAVLRPLHRYIEGLASTYRQVLQRLVDEGGAGGDLFSLGAATLALLGEASEHQPVIAVIDDLHWIDPASATILTLPCAAWTPMQ